MSGIGIGISPMFSKHPGSSELSTAYLEKLLAVESADMVSCLRLNELSGAIPYDSGGTPPNNESMNGVLSWNTAPGPDGFPTPSFATVDAYIFTWNTATDTDFSEFSLLVWAKRPGAWSADTLVGILGLFENEDAIELKVYADNTIHLDRTIAWSLNNTVSAPVPSGSDWEPILFTISETSDEMKLYVSGSQVGGTQTGLGAWAGVNPDFPILGANGQQWGGNLAYYTVWNKILTPAQVLSVSTI